MKRDAPSYHGYRFPPEIISHAVWLYHRFGVSFRDVEDLLAQRGITVSYEAIRLWCLTFGSAYARRLRRRQGRLGDIWHLDEVFVTIQGRRHYLWRAVDQDGDCGGGGGSRSAQKSIFPNTLGKPKRQTREKRSKAEVQVQNRYSDSHNHVEDVRDTATRSLQMRKASRGHHP